MKIRCRCLGCWYDRIGPPDESRRCLDGATQEDGLCDGCRNDGQLTPWLSDVVEVMA